MNFSYINILESTLSIAVFYAFYRAILKKETFFKVNRIYLLSSLLFSISIPFININSDFLPAFLSSNSDITSKVFGLRQSYYELNEVIIYAFR